MVLSSTARVMERRQIKAIIEEDPVDLIFRRAPLVRQADNSYAEGPEVSLEPQRVTLIPFKRRMTEFLVNTELGNVPDLPYVMVGEHDLNVRRGDRFTFQGDEFEVQTLDIKKEVRVAAHVDYFGGAPRG